MAIDQSLKPTPVLNSLGKRNIVRRIPTGLKHQVMPGERREPYEESGNPYQNEPRRLSSGPHS